MSAFRCRKPPHAKRDPEVVRSDTRLAHAVALFDLWLMSNLSPSHTGVDGAVIWVSAGEFCGAEAQHGPRIKVVLGTKLTPDGLREAASVTLTSPPEVLGTLPGKVRDLAVEFVRRNRDALLRHWNCELDTRETLDLLQRV